VKIDDHHAPPVGIIAQLWGDTTYKLTRVKRSPRPRFYPRKPKSAKR
jgi:hypothetical protein